VMYSNIGDCVNDPSLLWNGRYQIKKEIGKGQYGKVFLARDVNRFNGNK
jgi:serine/threonine protein kinase